MNFVEFKESLSKNTLHMVSKSTPDPISVYIFKEPAYLLKTSGSQGQKAFIHTQSSMKAASEAFFEQFDVSKNDKWGVCLSTEHVAGFSILARSHFGGLKDPYIFKWDITSFKEELLKNDVTIVSLVPTQVFDLVIKKVRAPKGFKFLFVGGAFISSDLIDRALDLGWPLVVCYGSTETFAQMSFSSDGEFFKPYKNWQVRISQSGELEVKGKGLYFAKVLEDGSIEKRTNEWFATGDLGEVDGEWFSLKGKLNGLVKIKGSYFDLNLFKKEFLKIKDVNLNDVFPVVLKEERNGAGLYLITRTGFKSTEAVLKKYPEIRGVFKFDEDIFSSIGKIQKSKLEDVLLKTVLCL